MSAAKAKSGARSTAKRAATGAAKTAAKSAAKGAAKTAAKTATKTGTRAVAAAVSSDRIGRGTRWTEDQVTLLLSTVRNSATAKQAFETVAKELGKSTGTVQQKYYNLQKAAGGSSAPRKRGRPAGSTNRSTASAAPRAASNGGTSAAALRTMTVDELVTLAKNVKGEIDRRSAELAAASKLLAG
jgi:hypothetical protein